MSQVQIIVVRCDNNCPNSSTMELVSSKGYGSHPRAKAEGFNSSPPARKIAGLLRCLLVRAQRRMHTNRRTDDSKLSD
jgi:hypothetical protein